MESEFQEVKLASITTNKEDLQSCTPETSSQESDTELIPCSTDAGHPRLSASRRLSEADQSSYYCSHCDVNFPPRELAEHFNNHSFFVKCQYCEHPVFNYIVNETKKVKIYHTCSYETEEPSSPASPDVNMNL